MKSFFFNIIDVVFLAHRKHTHANSEAVTSLMLVAETSKDLSSLKEQFSGGMFAVNAFSDAAKTTARQLRSSIMQATSTQKRNVAKVEQDKERDATQKVRETAAAATLALKEESEKTPAIYLTTTDVPQVVVAQSGFQREWDVDVPQLFPENVVEGMADFKASKAVQLMFATFAGAYKKTKNFKEQHSYTEPIKKGKGLEAVEEFLSKGVFHADSPVKPIAFEGSSAAMLKGVLATRWLCGSNPKKRFEQPARNGFANLRFQIGGKAPLYIVMPHKLGSIYGDNLDKVVESVKNMDDHLMQALINANSIYKVTVEPWAVLYIPAGSITYEDHVDGVLSYSMRTPLLPTTKFTLDAYTVFARLAKEAKRPAADKMEEVVEILKTSLT